MLENENDKRLKGVTIREHEHKVGQFADDTAAMLEGYQHLKKLFEMILINGKEPLEWHATDQKQH